MMILWKTYPTIAAKLGGMVTYIEGFLLINSYNASITWSCKVAWQTKTINSTLLERMWLPNLAG